MAEEKNAKVQPSGYSGDNPATAGPGSTKVTSNTPENRKGQLDPSAPNTSTHESGDTVPQNAQGMGTVGYGGENKPLAQPDGTAADLDQSEIVNANASGSGQKKSFRCADVGYTQCNWRIEGNSEQEILPKIKAHAAQVHHLEFKPEAEQNVHHAIRNAA